MNFLKNICTWLLMGIAIGAGFTISTSIISYFSMDYYLEKAQSGVEETYSKMTANLARNAQTNSTSSSSSPNSQKENTLSKIIITSHKFRKSSNNLEFLGVLENKSSDTLESILIEVELFDKDGNFVDECKDYLGSPVIPGQKENFIISCNCSRYNCNKTISDFDNYKIAVKSFSKKSDFF